MEVILQPDGQRAAALTAAIVAETVRRKPATVLGLATGRTMEPVYATLVQIHRDEGLDFSRVRAFNLDEYVGLSSDHAYSCRGFLKRHFFDAVNFDVRNIQMPDGMAEDLEAESHRYEAEIAASGGIDLQLLGIGVDGHIGFNEPLSALRSRTRVKALAPQTIGQNAALFGGPLKVPRRGITMGVGTILDSRRCIMLATGESKAEIVARAVEGPIAAMVTASALQLHPRCTVVVDEEAGTRLQAKEYYRWIFENEPEWEAFR